MDEILGYDISKHQGVVHHGAYREAGYRFCFIKATEGVGYRDPRFEENVSGCKSAGMPCGLYHFARVSRSPTLVRDAAAEAMSFADSYVDRGLELPGVLDIEWDKRVAKGIKAADIVKWCEDWIGIVAEETGRVPIVYTGPSFWKYKLGQSLALVGSHLWAADYRGSAQRRGGSKPIPGWPAEIWQKSGSHPRPDKPKGKVDLNQWMGTESEFDALIESREEHVVPLDSEIYQPPWARAIASIMGRLTESPRCNEIA